MTGYASNHGHISFSACAALTSAPSHPPLDRGASLSRRSLCKLALYSRQWPSPRVTLQGRKSNFARYKVAYHSRQFSRCGIRSRPMACPPYRASLRCSPALVLGLALHPCVQAIPAYLTHAQTFKMAQSWPFSQDRYLAYVSKTSGLVHLGFSGRHISANSGAQTARRHRGPPKPWR